jgi:DNA-binding NtrC family response regulator
MAHSTEPSSDRRGLPVRTLSVAVVSGPDVGARQVAESETLTVGTAEGNDLVLSDPTVSRFHLELVAGGDGIRVEDHASTNGTVFEGARISKGTVPAGATLRLGKTTIRVDDGERVTVALHAEDELSGLRGRTPVMRRLMAQIERAAAADSAVLLVGESGTGKELMARALHDQGPRANKPFVTVDCGSLSPSLVASELFGHEKGSFTGADARHVGAFERADGGTLFLDEIGELPTPLQSTLLGALERRRFRRVGGREEIAVDVRVVSATHRDLRAQVNDGAFRLDLYYRIAVVVLRVPPLRERREDIPLLVEHFLREAGVDGDIATVVPPDAMDALTGHSWPGNARELRNVVEATLVMGEAPPLSEAPSGPGGDSDVVERTLHHGYKEARTLVLDDFERRYCEALLARAEGNVSKAARDARMDRTYLIKLLARHGLK